MLDWLGNPHATGLEATAPVLACRIIAALVLGVAVAGLYRWARRGESSPPTFGRTLILMSAVIAMATQIIGNDVARAFSLVGALSVVRFRTIVKDTQDTAFVILAVVVGMACGADQLRVGLIGLGVLAVAAVALWPASALPMRRAHETLINLRITRAPGVRAAAEALLAPIAERLELTSASTARQGAALDLTYRARLRPGTPPTALVEDLGRIEGIESVELRRGD